MSNPQTKKANQSFIRSQISEDGNVNWIDLQREFNSLEDIREMVLYITEVIDECKICDNIECKIYSETHHLDLKLLNFTIYSLSEARSKITNSLELQRYESMYRDFLVACKSTWSKIRAMKNVRDTQEKTINAWHKRKIEMMKVANDNMIPTYPEFQSELGDVVKDVETQENAIRDRLFLQNKRKIQEQAKQVKIKTPN